MSDPVNDKNTPTSSQPSSPQDQENPFITPLTFQVHPLALPFNLNSGSPNFFSHPFLATVIKPTSFGSSFNSMASISQTENPVSPIKRNLRDATKPQNGKAQSSSSRKATTSKIPKVPKKAPVYWEDEKNSKGESAMSVLMNWITTYGNWSCYKSLVKSRTVGEIVDYLAQHGFHGQTVKNISELEKKFISAAQWLDGTGKGVMNDIKAEKKKEDWSNDNPEYLERKKSLIEDKATRLDGASSAAPNPADTSLDYNCNNQMKDEMEDEMEDNGTQIQPDEEQCAPVQSQSLHTSSSAPTSRLRHSNRQGGENQVSQLLAQPDNKTKCAITRLEDVFIKSELKNTAMKDIMKDLTGVLMPNNNSKSLLTKDEQVQQAQVAAKLKKCQLEAAELDVQKTKRSMDLELAIAKGKFISQLMKDNNIAYEQAKVITDDLYRTVEQRSEK
ncbi:hypothetical protein DFH28DRAFT_982815 [Melampsora americana]|nr:hypothetical protein DFH28DRAFT_982815 [Melampsora americana]